MSHLQENLRRIFFFHLLCNMKIPVEIKRNKVDNKNQMFIKYHFKIISKLGRSVWVEQG